MITAADLAPIKIDRAIFHDVPKRPPKFEGKPTLADLETKLDPKRHFILRSRLTNVLGSKQAYAMRFSLGPKTEVPKEVRHFTSAERDAEEFVAMSRSLAMQLFDLHTGATSPGLLCVMSVTSMAKSGVAVLKLERQEGMDSRITHIGPFLTKQVSA